jgi:hypothetical protein
MAIRNTDALITKDLINNCAVISKKIAELTPDSRNVICKRWEQATGKKAVLSAG